MTKIKISYYDEEEKEFWENEYDAYSCIDLPTSKKLIVIKGTKINTLEMWKESKASGHVTISGDNIQTIMPCCSVYSLETDDILDNTRLVINYGSTN